MTGLKKRVANALPTKDFFVYMLVRDITLAAAIIDLVDNSVDGAQRTRPKADYSGLWVRLETSAERFRIIDNCGGMAVDTAEKYAFRFGRDPEAPKTKHSIGQFGVGMKRALFKLGKAFEIHSRTANEEFKIRFELEEWLAEPVEWDLPISGVKSGLANPPDQRGVAITVSPLHEPVSADLVSQSFEIQLANEIRTRHQPAMTAGLAISLNGVALIPELQDLLASQYLKPAYEQHEFASDDARVGVKIYAGISESDPSRAGWYVYCNGRMILGADQTATTGWGTGGEATIPKYHNQYSRFRGFAFFDSDNAAALPWTTTKTAVDSGSEVYRRALQRMVVLMRPVIDFLNALDSETSDLDSRSTTHAVGSLAKVVDAAKPTALREIRQAAVFVAPPRVRRPPSVGNILYQRPLKQIRRLQEVFRVTTYREVGERTFDHYLKYEVGDE